MSDAELQKILSLSPTMNERPSIDYSQIVEDIDPETIKSFSHNGVQWASGDGKVFRSTSTTVDTLPPGGYTIVATLAGIEFHKMNVKTEGLIRFTDANSDIVIEEIRKFWNSKEVYRKYGLNYKRGICLWGPPGSGKSSCLRFVMNDVVELGGFVIEFTAPKLFQEGIKQIREIQPDVPIICTMEDLDSIMMHYPETDILNLLDGFAQIDNIVFLATTNYPEQLGARIINRPSRFDKRFKIGMPNAADRLTYLKHLFGDNDYSKFNLEQWVKDSENFSIAHLKELFTAAVIFENEYAAAVKTLQSMVLPITSFEIEDSGFEHRSGDELVGLGKFIAETRNREDTPQVARAVNKLRMSGKKRKAYKAK